MRKIQCRRGNSDIGEAKKGYDIRHLPLEATGHCLETPDTSDPSPATLAADAVVLDFISEILGVEK